MLRKSKPKKIQSSLFDLPTQEILGFIHDAHIQHPSCAEYLIRSLAVLVKHHLNTPENRHTLLLNTDNPNAHGIICNICFHLETLSYNNLLNQEPAQNQSNFNHLIKAISNANRSLFTYVLNIEFNRLEVTGYKDNTLKYQIAFNKLCDLPAQTLAAGLHARTGAHSLFKTAKQHNSLFDPNVLKLVNSLATGKKYNRK